MGRFAREKQTIKYPYVSGDDDLIVSTTPQLEGYRIERYIGVVFGDAVFDAAFSKIEAHFARDRAVAVHSMVRKAREIGANAVIGLSFNCGSFQRQGSKREICTISAYGTAVRVRNLAES
ncbi:MAG: heavy metal-binding domain-containing protein [Desulfobacterales bacterium]|nr:heavy metal-binding domain-containing protein [Desulfobacterales bacterium]MDJ0874656.1 heavy metal-binding domain-containing protein [Desulfobacterales bacterium]MDJ0884027.1 heavy metal-binding domain-containing protein [Desulfobacterales bacterium]